MNTRLQNKTTTRIIKHNISKAELSIKPVEPVKSPLSLFLEEHEEVIKQSVKKNKTVEMHKIKNQEFIFVSKGEIIVGKTDGRQSISLCIKKENDFTLLNQETDTHELTSHLLTGLSDATFLRFPMRVFFEFLQKHPNEAISLGEKLSKDISSRQQNFSIMNFLSAQQKVICCLVELGTHFQKRKAPPLTVTKMATFVAVSRETFSRHISEIIQSKIVQQRGSRIFISETDWKQLFEAYKDNLPVHTLRKFENLIPKQ